MAHYWIEYVHMYISFICIWPNAHQNCWHYSHPSPPCATLTPPVTPPVTLTLIPPFTLTLTQPSPLPLLAVIPVKWQAKSILYHCTPLGQPHCHSSLHLPSHRVQHYIPTGLCCSQHCTAIDWEWEPAKWTRKKLHMRAEGVWVGVLGVVAAG